MGREGMNTGGHSQARSDLMRIYAAAISSVSPRRVIARALDGAVNGAESIPAIIDRAATIYLLAVGKAATGMAAECVRRFERKFARALVIVPAARSDTQEQAEIEYPEIGSDERVQIMRASHPLPDESSQRAGRSAIEFVSQLRANDLLVFALSGGASALMAVPADAIPLADKIAITQALMRAGANIRELNTVRKHLSAVKGGQLLRALNPGARVLGLILSDVPGNDLATIGSGPAAADATTYFDAISILKRRRVWGRAPESVRDYLERGNAGEFAETVKAADEALTRVSNFIIGDNETAIAAASNTAVRLGYSVKRVRELSGEANNVGCQIASDLAAIEDRRVCVLTGGEPVVTVRGNGSGGRAQQSALAMAIELARHNRERKLLAMFAGTDGIDGPTDAAGAIVTANTVERAAESGLNPETALDRNDAYPFFKALGDLVIIGPTGTNVADIFIGLVNY